MARYTVTGAFINKADGQTYWPGGVVVIDDAARVEKLRAGGFIGSEVVDTEVDAAPNDDPAPVEDAPEFEPPVEPPMYPSAKGKGKK